MNKNQGSLCVYHQEPAIVVCTNQACHSQRYCCLKCMQDQHADHIKLCIKYEQYQEKGELIMQDLQQLVNRLQNQVKLILQITSMNQQTLNFDKIAEWITQVKKKSKDVDSILNDIIEQCNEKKQDKQELIDTAQSILQMSQDLEQAEQKNNNFCTNCQTSLSSILLLKCGHQFCSKCVEQNQNKCCQCQGSIIQFGYTMTQCRVCLQYHQKDETGLVPTGLCRACALKQNNSSSKIFKVPQLQLSTSQNEQKLQQLKEKPQISLNQTRKLVQRQLSFHICDICKLNCEKMDLFQNSFCGHYYCFACSHLANQHTESLEDCLVKDCNCCLNITQLEIYYYEKQNSLLESIKRI